MLIYFITEDELEYMTTTESPALGYNVEVKLIDLGENFVVPHQGSTQYDDLSNQIQDNFKPVFNKLPGYRRLTVEELRE